MGVLVVIQATLVTIAIMVPSAVLVLGTYWLVGRFKKSRLKAKNRSAVPPYIKVVK